MAKSNILEEKKIIIVESSVNVFNVINDDNDPFYIILPQLTDLKYNDQPEEW